MKTIITILVALLPFSSFGQRFMIGINGGLLFNTPPFDANDFYSNADGNARGLFGIKAGVDIRKIQVGVGVLFSSLEYNYDWRWAGNVQPPSPYTFEYTSSYTNPYVFINIKKSFVRSYLYFGANLGIALIGDGTNSVYNTSPFVHMYNQRVPSESGVTLGLQGGYRVRIVRGLGASAEVGLRYVSTAPHFVQTNLAGFPIGTWQGDGFLSFPVMLGLDYAF